MDTIINSMMDPVNSNMMEANVTVPAKKPSRKKSQKSESKEPAESKKGSQDLSSTKDKRKFSCDKCSFVTAYLYSFTRHKSNVHKDSVPHKDLAPTNKPHTVNTNGYDVVESPTALPSVDTIKRKTVNHDSEIRPEFSETDGIELNINFPNILDSLNYGAETGLNALKFETTDGISVNLFEHGSNVGKEMDESDFITFRKGDETEPLSTIDQKLTYSFENVDHLTKDNGTMLLAMDVPESLNTGKINKNDKVSASKPRSRKNVSEPNKNNNAKKAKRQSVKAQLPVDVNVLPAMSENTYTMSENVEQSQAVNSAGNQEVSGSRAKTKTSQKNGKKSRDKSDTGLKLNLRRPVPPVLVSATVAKCPLCEFSSKYRSNTARHFQTTHKFEFQEVLAGRVCYEGIVKKNMSVTKAPKKTEIKKKKDKIGSENSPFLPGTFPDDYKNHPPISVNQNGMDNYPSAAQQLAQFVQEENLEMYATDSTDNIDGLNVPLESSFIESILSNVMGAETEEWSGVLNPGLGTQYESTSEVYGADGQHFGFVPITSHVEMSQLPVSCIQPLSNVMKSVFESPESTEESIMNVCAATSTTNKGKRRAAKQTCSRNVKMSKKENPQIQNSESNRETMAFNSDAQTIVYNQFEPQQKDADVAKKSRWNRQRKKEKLNQFKESANSVMPGDLNQTELFNNLPYQQSIINEGMAPVIPLKIPQVNTAEVHNSFVSKQFNHIDLNTVQCVLLSQNEQSKFLNSVTSGSPFPPTSSESLPVISSSSEVCEYVEVPVLTNEGEKFHQDYPQNIEIPLTLGNQLSQSNQPKSKVQIQNETKSELSTTEKEKLREIRNAKRREKYHEKLKKILTPEEDAKRMLALSKRKERQKSRKISQQSHLVSTEPVRLDEDSRVTDPDTKSGLEESLHLGAYSSVVQGNLVKIPTVSVPGSSQPRSIALQPTAVDNDKGKSKKQSKKSKQKKTPAETAAVISSDDAKLARLQRRRQQRKEANERKKNSAALESTAGNVGVPVTVSSSVNSKNSASNRKACLDPELVLSRKERENARRRERRRQAKEQKMLLLEASVKQEEIAVSVPTTNSEDILNQQQLFHPVPIQTCQAVEAYGSANPITNITLLPESKPILCLKSEECAVDKNSIGATLSDVGPDLVSQKNGYRLPNECQPSCGSVVEGINDANTGMQNSVINSEVNHNQANTSVTKMKRTTLILSAKELEVKKRIQYEKRREKRKAITEMKKRGLESLKSKCDNLAKIETVSTCHAQINSNNNLNICQGQPSQTQNESFLPPVDLKELANELNAEVKGKNKGNSRKLKKMDENNTNGQISEGTTNQVEKRRKTAKLTKSKQQNKTETDKGKSTKAEKKIAFINMNPHATVQRCPSSDCDFETDSRYRLMVHMNFHETVDSMPVFIKSIVEATGNLNFVMKLQSSHEAFSPILTETERDMGSPPFSGFLLE